MYEVEGLSESGLAGFGICLYLFARDFGFCLTSCP